jgi:hypothetical protein
VQQSVDMSEACRLVAGFARLPLAHDVVSACSLRTKAGVSYLLGEGVPREATAIAANFVADLSPHGLDHVYASGDVMHNSQPYTPMPFSRRVAHDEGRPADWKRRGTVREGEAVFTRAESSGVPGVRTGSSGARNPGGFPTPGTTASTPTTSRPPSGSPPKGAPPN